MFKIVGLRIRKPRQFEYKPRFFDPEAEAREERRRQLREQSDETVDEQPRSDEYHPGEYIRRNMYIRRGIGSSRDRADSKIKMMRVAIFVAIAVMLLAFIFL